MIRNILTIGSWTLLSRISGFLRDCLIAAFMGADGSSDSFFVALMLPNFFRRFFAEGAFSSVFIPQFAEIRTQRGDVSARHYAQNILSALLWILISLVVLFEVFMPFVVSWLAPGFKATLDRFHWTIQMARLMFPYVLFVSMANAFAGILNSFGKFSAATAMQMLFNLCMITFLLAFGSLTTTPGHALAMGVIVSGILHFVLMRRLTLPLMPIQLHIPKRTPESTVFLKRFIAASLGAGVLQITALINTFFASFLIPGSVTCLFYADRLVQFPLSIIGLALTTALLPDLSKAVQEQKKDHIAVLQNRSLRIVLMLTVPATVGLLCLAHPIIQVLYQRGAFNAADTATTASILMAYALGLPAFILGKVASTCFFANKDTKTPAIAALFFVATHCIGAFLFCQKFGLGAWGIAFSFSLGSWINTLLLGALLWHKQLLLLKISWKSTLLRILCASGLMGLFLFLSQPFFSSPTWGSAAFFLFLQITISVGIFLGLSLAFGLIPYALLKEHALQILQKSFAHRFRAKKN